MDLPAEQVSSTTDVMMLKLAREIAMDIQSIEDILKNQQVSAEQWEEIQRNQRFKSYLSNAVEEWQSATNTPERVKLKSMAFVEEALPEFFARAHDPKETLAAKTEVLKTIAKFAGVGGSVEGAVTGERMVVTINLGADNQLRIERDVTPQVIEGDYE